MPTYEYACTSCGEHLEVVQSFRDDPLTECPACSGQLRKVFGSIGVVFKGSGFYKTDSRTASSTAKTAQSAEAKSSEAKSKDASSTANAAEGSSGKSSEGSSGSGSSKGSDSSTSEKSSPKTAAAS